MNEIKNESKFGVLYFFWPFICIRAPIVHKFHLCEKKNRKTNRQTKKNKKKKKKISWIRGFIQFLFIPNISRFEFVLKKKEEEKEKKEKEKEKEMEMEKEIEKEKEKEMEKEMEKEKEKEVNRGAILCATSLFRSSLPTSYPTGKWTTMKIKLKIGIQIKIPK